jgi:hypothetical protein
MIWVNQLLMVRPSEVMMLRTPDCRSHQLQWHQSPICINPHRFSCITKMPWVSPGNGRPNPSQLALHWCLSHIRKLIISNTWLTLYAFPFLSSGPIHTTVKRYKLHNHAVPFGIAVLATVMTHFSIYIYCGHINQHTIRFSIKFGNAFWHSHICHQLR